MSSGYWARSWVSLQTAGPCAVKAQTCLKAANLLPRHMPCHSILLGSPRWQNIFWGSVKSYSSFSLPINSGKGTEMLLPQTFLKPSNTDVLIINTVPKQSENWVVADFLKRKWKKIPCQAALANFIFCSSMVLTGDLVWGKSYPCTRTISVANEMHISSRK